MKMFATYESVVVPVHHYGKAKEQVYAARALARRL